MALTINLIALNFVVTTPSESDLVFQNVFMFTEVCMSALQGPRSAGARSSFPEAG